MAVGLVAVDVDVEYTKLLDVEAGEVIVVVIGPVDELVADVIVLTVVTLVAAEGSNLPILLFDHSVNHTMLSRTAIPDGRLPLVGSLYSVM